MSLSSLLDQAWQDVETQVAKVLLKTSRPFADILEYRMKLFLVALYLVRERNDHRYV